MKNREILFRGITASKPYRIVEGDLLQNYIHHQGFLTIIQDGCIYNKIIPATVGQFTGRLDVDGRKVFEGDKVNYSSDGRINAYSGDYIRYSQGSFKVFRVDDEKSWFPVLQDAKHIKVIGTIHDHLLEANNE